jgi:PAB-dependent poly(A)-specific ribonuclease subunit 3
MVCKGGVPSNFSSALYFVYHYHPEAETVESKHLLGNKKSEFVPEAVLWSYISQLVSAIKAIHSAGLAYKTLIPSKILVTGKNRYTPAKFT